MLDSLAREGVDVSHVLLDPQRLTALVFLSIRSRTAFPLLFYRDRCADMALKRRRRSAFIASAASVLISGTHLSQPGSYAACRQRSTPRAQPAAASFSTSTFGRCCGGCAAGDGETRYVQAPSVSASLQAIIATCDLIVGTEEEFCIAANMSDPLAAVIALRQKSTCTLVLKRGAIGCTIYPGMRGAAAIDVPGSPIEVFNVLGAGDAFMAGFLSGWLRDASLAECGRRANACGALVVSRHGCAPAIPTADELDHFLQHGARRRACAKTRR